MAHSPNGGAEAPDDDGSVGRGAPSLGSASDHISQGGSASSMSPERRRMIRKNPPTVNTDGLQQGLRGDITDPALAEIASKLGLILSPAGQAAGQIGKNGTPLQNIGHGAFSAHGTGPGTAGMLLSPMAMGQQPLLMPFTPQYQKPAFDAGAPQQQLISSAPIQALSPQCRPGGQLLWADDVDRQLQAAAAAAAVSPPAAAVRRRSTGDVPAEVDAALQQQWQQQQQALQSTLQQPRSPQSTGTEPQQQQSTPPRQSAVGQWVRKAKDGERASAASAGSPQQPRSPVVSPEMNTQFISALSALSPVQEPCSKSGYEAPMPSPLSPAVAMPDGMQGLGGGLSLSPVCGNAASPQGLGGNLLPPSIVQQSGLDTALQQQLLQQQQAQMLQQQYNQQMLQQQQQQYVTASPGGVRREQQGQLDPNAAPYGSASQLPQPGAPQATGDLNAQLCIAQLNQQNNSLMAHNQSLMQQLSITQQQSLPQAMMPAANVAAQQQQQQQQQQAELWQLQQAQQAQSAELQVAQPTGLSSPHQPQRRMQPSSPLQPQQQQHALVGGGVQPAGQPAAAPGRAVAPEERILVNQVESYLLNKHTNKFMGSVPVVVVQRVVMEANPEEYKAVVERSYSKSFHAFLRSHPQLRVFHYDADVIQARNLHHCSPHEGRLAFSDIPNLELIQKDLQTAEWKSQRWSEVLDEVEAVIRETPMQMRVLLQHFRERPNAEEYVGALPSNHALRQLLKRDPMRFVITHDATVKLPEQLTDEEREEWLAKVKSAEAARRGKAAAQAQAGAGGGKGTPPKQYPPAAMATSPPPQQMQAQFGQPGQWQPSALPPQQHGQPQGRAGGGGKGGGKGRRGGGKGGGGGAPPARHPAAAGYAQPQYIQPAPVMLPQQAQPLQLPPQQCGLPLAGVGGALHPGDGGVLPHAAYIR